MDQNNNEALFARIAEMEQKIEHLEAQYKLLAKKRRLEAKDNTTPHESMQEQDVHIKRLKLSDAPRQHAKAFIHRRCVNFMVQLMQNKNSYIFHEPVDAVAYGIPDYHDIIKDPMDFGTIRKKCENTEYSSLIQFENDIALVFSNCRLYYKPGTHEHEAADIVQALYERRFKAIKDAYDLELEQMQQLHL